MARGPRVGLELNGRKMVLVLGDEVVLGRNEGAILAASHAVSRRHLVIARERGVGARIDIGYEATACRSDLHLSNALAAAVKRLGMTERRLPSGAGHDAMAFDGRIPIAMLFIRCRGGISHDPAEYAAPDDIEIGARVLLDFIDHLADWAIAVPCASGGSRAPMAS